jgi:glycopeptide antibiotics resistance protein
VSRPAKAAAVLLVLYSAVLVVALFSPSSDVQSGAVEWLVVRLHHIGFASATFPRLEIVMNAVIIAPVTFLASSVRPRYTWRDWTALGFVVAVAVEVLQGLLLPGRHAAFSDVVANTAGAFLGAFPVHLLRGRLASRRWV